MKQVPVTYFDPARHPGRVDRVDYGRKYALVYTPQGKAKNILYLIHGGGGDQQAFFCTRFLNMIDNMIENGDLEPLYIVSPTYYDPDETDKTPANSGIAVEKFSRELREEIIPRVEAFCGLKAERTQRAVGGFSMGGVATWYAFLQALDLFYWFMPLSGDCWICGEKGGGDKPEGTARLLAEAAKEDFRIHAVTGTKDIAFPNLDPQIQAMRAFPQAFRFGENIRYDLLEGGVHDYETIFRYIFNALPGFFH